MRWESELFGESNCVITVEELVGVLNSDQVQHTHSLFSVDLQIKVWNQ